MNKKGTPVRLNIYLPDRSMRQRVKSAAAKQDLSISEYCVRALGSKLAKDEETAGQDRDGSGALHRAVLQARSFQATIFGQKVFSTSSADLINVARNERDRGVRSRRR